VYSRKVKKERSVWAKWFMYIHSSADPFYHLLLFPPTPPSSSPPHPFLFLSLTKSKLSHSLHLSKHTYRCGRRRRRRRRRGPPES